MVMAMNAACPRTAATCRGLAVKRFLLSSRCRPGAIPAEGPYRRPIRHCRRWRLVIAGKLAGAVDHVASDHRQIRLYIGDLVLAAGKVVAVRHDEIGELTDGDATLLPLLVGEPSHVLGPHPERGLTIETIVLRVDS